MGVTGLKQFLNDPSAYYRDQSNRSVTSDFNLLVELRTQFVTLALEVNISSKIPISSTWDTQTPSPIERRSISLLMR